MINKACQYQQHYVILVYSRLITPIILFICRRMLACVTGRECVKQELLFSIHSFVCSFINLSKLKIRDYLFKYLFNLFFTSSS